MSSIKMNVRGYNKAAKKKHVESMFLTNKQKNYPFYFKDKKLMARVETQLSKFYPSRGHYSIKSLQSGYVTIDSLKAVMRLYKWFLRAYRVEDGLFLNFMLFPDFVLTSKPKEMRMGKGKGAPSQKVAAVKAGGLLLKVENRGISPFLAGYFVKLLSWKVPFKHVVLHNTW